MKKILKYSIALLVLMVAMVFTIPTVSAETTTAPTTQETTEIITDNALTQEEINLKWQELKLKIQLAIIGFLSSATFGAIAGAILYKLYKKALAKVDEAVESNQISQGTANKAKEIIELNYTKLNDKVDELTESSKKELETRAQHDERVQLLLDKYEERDTQLAELIDEYIGDESDD